MRRVQAFADPVLVARLLGRAAPLLGCSGDRTVVILAPAGRHRQLGSWLRHFAGDDLHVVLDRPVSAGTLSAPAAVTVHCADDPAAIARVLDGIGPVNVLVDLRHARLRRYQETWAAVAFYLRAGGVYLVRPCDPRWGRAARILAVWAALLGGAAQAKLGDRVVRPYAADNSDLARGALVYPEGLVVVKRADHLLFVRDDEIAGYVPRRNPPLKMSVLGQLPAGVLRGRVEVTSHEASVPIIGLESELPYPALQLRHYEGHVAFYGNTLLVSGNLVLPDSHRFYRMEPLNHPIVTTWPAAPRFGTLPRGRPGGTLPGTYYLLDPQFTGHYGHLLTEVIPRLWGWDEAKRRYPDLKALTMVRRGKSSEPVLDRLLPAYGIDPADLVYIDTPAELESVITASAMWHNFAPHFAHPDLVEIWERIADQVVDSAAPNWERIFLTRARGSYRTCHNAADVEALFRSYGFEILRPEQFDLGVQAGFFRTATVIAGFGGSQMFNMMYAAGMRQLIVLCHESYSARNEHLYSALRGGKADWFWSAPDRGGFHADWSFDFERNGAELEKLLASL